MINHNATTFPGGLSFRRVGGSYQPAVSGFADFPALLELDEAHWALTSVDIDVLRVPDRRFLEIMDSDGNRKLRTDEVKAALAFMVRNLRDGSGVDRGDDTLRLDAINPESPEAPVLLAAARLILANLGRSDGDAISLDEVRRDKDIRSRAESNGDGVVVPEPESEPELAETINAVMAVAGSVTDLSGVAGIGAAQLEEFAVGAAHRLELLDEPIHRADEVMPFGDETESLYAEVEALDGVIREYFLAAEAVAFLHVGASGWSDQPEDLSPEGFRAMLERRTVAEPRADGALDFSAALNPLYRDRLLALASNRHFRPVLADGLLTRRAWEEFSARFAAFADYRRRVGESGKFTGFSREELQRLAAPERLERLRMLIASDQAAAGALAGGTELHKLLLLQKYMLGFLNNFVSLGALFDPARVSLLQAGKLVMDGRHFTLVIPVANPAEHKRIAGLSDICTIYLEVSSGIAGAPPRILAAAVTSGNMRNLFVGKRGVFFPADGGIADARVIDFIEQPVSVSEALVSPFFKFGAFVGRQADKFFTAKSAAAQKELGGMIADGKIAVPAAKPEQTPAVSGSMMLMGGGIGLAAIGSSVAFIVKSLQQVSVVNVLVVLFGIILVFGGPMVAVALFKLYRRNLSRFLEASGCAVNRPMRLSRRMGRIFSFTPVLPYGKLLRQDLVKVFERGGEVKVPRLRWWWVVLLLIVIIAAVALRWFFPLWAGV